MLDLWALGCTSTQIADAINRDTGSNFQSESVHDFIARAREEGDPRAIYRKSSRLVVPVRV